MRKTVVFYRTTDGKCPVQEFLDSLPGKAAQKITWVLNLIEDLDIVPSAYFKKLVSTMRSGSAEFSLAPMRIGYFVFSMGIPLLY